MFAENPTLKSEKKDLARFYLNMDDVLSEMKQELLSGERHWRSVGDSVWVLDVGISGLKLKDELKKDDGLDINIVSNLNEIIRDRMEEILKRLLQGKGYELELPQNVPISDIADAQAGYADRYLDVIDPNTKIKIATVKVACHFDTKQKDSLSGHSYTGSGRLKIKIIQSKG